MRGHPFHNPQGIVLLLLYQKCVLLFVLGRRAQRELESVYVMDHGLEMKYKFLYLLFTPISSHILGSYFDFAILAFSRKLIYGTIAALGTLSIRKHSVVARCPLRLLGENESK